MLICREVADSVNGAGESGAKKIITLLVLAGVGYVLWREYQKQSAPTPAPTAATVAETRADSHVGTMTDINAVVNDLI